MRIATRSLWIHLLLLLAGAGLFGPPAARAEGSTRLSHAAVPVFESVNLVVDADKTDYTGSVHIELKVTQPTRTFQFHSEGLTLKTMTLKGPSGSVDIQTAPGENAIVTATAASELAPGAYTLDIDFSNRFNTRALGLYRLDKRGHGYAFTQFEDTEARKAFPCWDEPGFKIPWQLTLTVPKAHLALSNTPIEKETVNGEQRTVVFARTRPLPSYLVALATGPLETVNVPGMRIPARVVTTQGDVGMAAEAVRDMPLLLTALEQYFGRPYPYDKLDLIAVPEFNYGAMENPGAITFRESVLLMDPKSASVSQRRHMANDLTHEMAHQWFGDLVTMAWWDDLWLNESFATWLGEKTTDKVFPELGIAASSPQSDQTAMASDALLHTRAMRQPVTGADNLSQSADELAYNKGKGVLSMFEQWMGPDVFRKGVIAYLKAHEWGNATASDLWKALSEASGKDVGAAMSTFLDQPGVPRVDVEPLAGGKVRLTQRRFLLYGVTAPKEQLWQIPLVLKYSDGKAVQRKSVMLTAKSEEVELAPGATLAWVLPHGGEAGYYRWSVPPAMLASMAQHSREIMDVPERVAFIGNLGALLDAGVVHGDEYLRTLGAFSEDSSPEVISALAGALERVRGAFVTTRLREPFARYVRATLGPSVRRFGLAKAPGEAESVSLLRPMLMGLMGRTGQDEHVQAYADSLAREYLKNSESIDPALAGVALRLSARRGDRALFDEYRRRFEAAKDPAERGYFLSALGGFHDSTLVAEALHYTLTGPLRPQEVFDIPRGMMEWPEYEDRNFEWFKENYAVLVAKMPPMFRGFMPFMASGCSAKRLEAAKVFFADPAHQGPGTMKQLARVEERVMDCVGLREREGASVEAYLSQNLGAK